MPIRSLLSDRRLTMDTLYTLLTIKLISLLFLDSKPPNSLDTLMNVWCLGWISKIRSREGISLILSTFTILLAKMPDYQHGGVTADPHTLMPKT